ncbi:hypothetical protein A5724_20130 [Mycobacterium sp. ACS1612]|uniref:hypothetical protein n=1 Tax=Mycobacterium sp. ACS1612 TaxID=1834117 RepID=UPI0007FB7FCC|nr:hypothetical protein [Mycobacterium sp. ACS1612]OBF32946.1 hypothetical protein A5724_20130 [Mycobacterium sp. ACS1612]
MQSRPTFLITVDTEGDNLWSCPREIHTDNARFLQRFQELCDRYGFKPTYLTNYEMAMDPDYVAWARDQQAGGAAEVGMHLHAWNSPPLKALTRDDFRYTPYLTDYADDVMREKIRFITDLLTVKFDRQPTSHRAGRWGFDERYANMLVDHGYIVDCSVVPGVSFSEQRGDPNRSGGPDYRVFPAHAYCIDPQNIGSIRAEGLLELPVTTMFRRPRIRWLGRMPAVAGKVGRRLQDLVWLRPNGRNLEDMMWCVDRAMSENRPYIEFMLHSSELMPGGSPYFPTTESVELLYEHLKVLFERIAKSFAGETLTGYAERLLRS